ncbi:MAG: hypothetical protein QOJ04_160, partial [Caballeronia sp.]|nr:hypothetical protein [Caballeronia sp.]
MSASDKAPQSPQRRTLLGAAAIGSVSLLAARAASAQTDVSGVVPGQPTHRVNQPEGGAADTDTTADIIVNTLLAWDVDHVFGMVGDGINPLIEALRRHRDKIRFVGVRHEEAAAFMASGWAKSTGRLGVCMATT